MPAEYMPSPFRRPTSKRKCLKCGKLFQSKGPANRICKNCNEINLKNNRYGGENTKHPLKGKGLPE